MHLHCVGTESENRIAGNLKSNEAAVGYIQDSDKMSPYLWRLRSIAKILRHPNIQTTFLH